MVYCRYREGLYDEKGMRYASHPGIYSHLWSDSETLPVYFEKTALLTGGENLKSYYILEIIQANVPYYVLWYTNDKDGFVVNKGHLLSFATIEALQCYCEKVNISPDPEKETYDLDRILEYLGGNRVIPDCEVLLNFWNLASDLAHTIGCNLCTSHDQEVSGVYDKLFYASNLPAINTSPRKYIPIWSADELEIIRQISQKGWELFSECLGGIIDQEQSEE